jgi:predicted Rossmann-fold nucleotide-binding protein
MPANFGGHFFMNTTSKNPRNGGLDVAYLEGPHGRFYELGFLFRVFVEFLKAYRRLHFIGPCITVFGSARFGEDHEYYKLAQKTSARIGQMGFGIMTGGGPGIMEAANRGAKETGAYSIGVNIKLPFEQKPNPYLDRWVEIRYFFVRKVIDEMYEALTLIQTKKMPWFPVVLMGKEYWQSNLDQIALMHKMKTISPEDDDMLCITDDPEEAARFIEEKVRPFATRRHKYKPLWWLGEK